MTTNLYNEKEQGIYEDGYHEAIQDAEKGLLKGSGIYTTAQVKTFLECYRSAIRLSIENDIKGVFRLGNRAGDEERLADKVIKEADDKFSGMLDQPDKDAE